MISPSCFDCQNCKTWDYPATREEPGDSGFDCKLFYPVTISFEELEDIQTSNISDDEISEAIAAVCPEYIYLQPEPPDDTYNDF